MNDDRSVVRTPRLSLYVWNARLVDAFAAADRVGAQDALGILFPEPFGPPPETEDVLDFFRTMIGQDVSDGVFLPRMMVRDSDLMAIGSIGLLPPDPLGASMIGFSVYPGFEGEGYASEAAAALVEWGVGKDGVTSIFATIPDGHRASEIVAGRAGLKLTGRQIEQDGMTLNVWERGRA